MKKHIYFYYLHAATCRSISCQLQFSVVVSLKLQYPTTKHEKLKQDIRQIYNSL